MIDCEGMQLSSQSTAAAILLALFAAGAAAQETPARDPMAIAPRATPGDYQAQAHVGPITIGAEFTGPFHRHPGNHTIRRTGNYVVVEVGVPSAFPKPALKNFPTKISPSAINWQESALARPHPTGSSPKMPKIPHGRISLQPRPRSPRAASAPAEVGSERCGTAPCVSRSRRISKRAMEEKVMKASLPEADRPLPEAPV